MVSSLEHPRGALPHEDLRDVTVAMFDWNEMAGRMLGSHWAARTESERQHFVGLLGGLVLAQIVALGSLGGESVQYVGESVNHDTAVVETRIPRGPEQELQLDYRLRWRDAGGCATSS